MEVGLQETEQDHLSTLSSSSDRRRHPRTFLPPTEFPQDRPSSFPTTAIRTNLKPETSLIFGPRLRTRPSRINDRLRTLRQREDRSSDLSVLLSGLDEEGARRLGTEEAMEGR